MDLKNLIETAEPALPQLAKDLDELGHFGRTWSVQQWTRKDMASVWEAAKGFRPVTLDDFVPPTALPMTEVVHEGKNSMPVPAYFEKRFCRSRDVLTPSGPALFGYNDQPFAAFSGPGYYVARPSADEGEVDLDYTTLPSDKPQTWPPVRPNSERFGRWVFAGLVDVMRGLSSHVTIGRGKRRNAWIDTWFVLVRRDMPPQHPGDPTKAAP